MTALCTTLSWLLMPHAPWEPDTIRLPLSAVGGTIYKGIDGYWRFLEPSDQTPTAVVGWARL